MPPPEEFKKRYGLIYVNKNDDGTGDFPESAKILLLVQKVIESCKGEALTESTASGYLGVELCSRMRLLLASG